MGKERYTCSVQAPALGPLPYSITELPPLPSGEVDPDHFAGWEQVTGRGADPHPTSLFVWQLCSGAEQGRDQAGEEWGRQGNPINFSSLKSI